MLAPVFAAMRAASSRPFSRSAEPGEQQHRRLARAQRARGLLHGVLARRCARSGIAGTFAGPAAFVPRGVAGQDQRRDLPGRRHRGRDRGGAVGGDVFAVGEVFTQPENGFAAVSMSEVSGES